MFISFAAAALAAAAAASQQPPAPVPQDPHAQHAPSPGAKPSWMFMQDGVAFVTFNNQGGPRGDREVVSQNWWMGMWSRPTGGGDLVLSLMLSADPLTQYGDGYALLFQAGETYDGRPIVDRQHPHDFLMQAAVAWRRPVGRGYHLTLAAAPVGEPALGPVAFMHRQAAAETLAAPLGHHTIDSTHISNGVITAGVDRGEWAFESSIFRGREPDEQRWDLMDPGALDSWSARVWYRPTAALEFQASYGFLNQPERLEPYDVKRISVSGSWTKNRANGYTALAGVFGRNDKPVGGSVAWLGEATHRLGRTTLFTRGETLQVETILLLFGVHGHVHDPGETLQRDWVSALTLGATRDVMTWRRYEIAVGGDVTGHRVPLALREAYGDSPVSFHLFLRVRPPAPMGRMWNHVMSRLGSLHQH